VAAAEVSELILPLMAMGLQLLGFNKTWMGMVLTGWSLEDHTKDHFKLMLIKQTQQGWQDGEGEGARYIKQFHFVLDAISAQQAGTFISTGV
jgi:hypothetical protein